MNDFIKELKATARFHEAMKTLLDKRPIVPRYAACSTVEERETLIETIKIKTGEQNGFDCLYQLLTGATPP